jgi:hypothetical protein
MTFAQIVTEIERLSIEERLKLMEALTRSFHADLQPRRKIRKGSALARVRGVLRQPGGKIPTDQDWKDDYISHQARKHQ